MTLKILFYIMATTFCALTCLAPIPSLAQESDSNDTVKSLGDILNEPTEYGEKGEPLTSTALANNYFKFCATKESLALNEEEKEILCSCTAAKMSETLSVQDFQDLKSTTTKGRDARGRMLAFSYAPCMEHVIEQKAKRDCQKSNKLEDIITGKEAICDCVTERTNQYVNKNAAHIVMQAMHYDPMTLDPLDYFFANGGYYAQHAVFMRQCRFNFVYYRDNR